jgi:hypothetical protein
VAFDFASQLERMDELQHLLNFPGGPPIQSTTYFDHKALVSYRVSDGKVRGDMGKRWVAAARFLPAAAHRLAHLALPPLPHPQHLQCTKGTATPLPPAGTNCLAPGGVATLGSGSWGPVKTSLYTDPAVSQFENVTITAAAGPATMGNLMSFRLERGNSTELFFEEALFKDYVRVCQALRLLGLQAAPSPPSPHFPLTTAAHCLPPPTTSPHPPHPPALKSTAPIPAAFFAIPAICK